MSDLVFISSLLSPFGARLRLACAFKGLNANFIPPPGGTGSDQYKKTNPYGRIPALLLEPADELLGGEEIVVESIALLEFLEDAYPDAPVLRSATPILNAKSRMIALLFDHNVIPALFGVFKELTKPEPDVAAAQRAFDEVERQLEKLVSFFGNGELAVDDTLSHADIVVAPFALLIDLLAEKFACSSPTQRVARFKQWWQKMQSFDEAQPVFAVMKEGLAAMAAGNKK